MVIIFINLQSCTSPLKLIIDIGNTRVKLARFINKELDDITIADSLMVNVLEEYIDKKGPFSSCILSSVVNVPHDMVSLMHSMPFFVELTENTPLPVHNRYETPGSLGKDRIAAAVAAAFHYPGRNVLTIDAGTCITYDLVTAGREYLGGGISPGISMRFKALNTFTGRLPFIEAEEFDRLIGRSTRESILSGIMNGVTEEVNGIIRRYRADFPDLMVVVTGGDHKILCNQLKNSIFALPELVVTGLNEILDYNKNLA